MGAGGWQAGHSSARVAPVTSTSLGRVGWVLLLSGCLLSPQKLESPCVGVSDAGACPACVTDADCAIASNPCYPTASCVPVAGNWAVTLLGCTTEHPPPVQQCGCVDSVCRAK